MPTTGALYLQSVAYQNISFLFESRLHRNFCNYDYICAQKLVSFRQQVQANCCRLCFKNLTGVSKSTFLVDISNTLLPMAQRLASLFFIKCRNCQQLKQYCAKYQFKSVRTSHSYTDYCLHVFTSQRYLIYIFKYLNFLHLLLAFHETRYAGGKII